MARVALLMRESALAGAAGALATQERTLRGASTADEIVDAVAEHHRRWGITRYVVRADAMEAMTALLPRLAAIG